MKIENLIRDNIKRLKPYTCARDSYSEGVLLDANENTLGSTFEYYNLELNRYPDPLQINMRRKLSALINIPIENLVFGVGSDELIDLIIRIFCNPGIDNTVIVQPTYGMYHVCCDINNVEVREAFLSDQFEIEVDSIMNKVGENTKIVFLCSPNNPTGNTLSSKSILELCEKTNAIIVVDEAYIDFDEENSVISEILNQRNLIVLRTFSKAWGLAAIRCGYCAADKEVINTIIKVKAPYTINKLTEKAVVESINNFRTKEKFVDEIITQREFVFKKLNELEKVQKVFKSDSNFILFKCKNASEVHRTLAERGVVIRDRSSQEKLENCLRVSIGTEIENRIMLSELEKVL
ncbi:MAG: histidinol-phosphate transaminase [Melioribacteraceae bacterium]|nr:histidinol-phosphate transaminase [Melioribacteraceae bacterium]